MPRILTRRKLDKTATPGKHFHAGSDRALLYIPPFAFSR